MAIWENDILGKPQTIYYIKLKLKQWFEISATSSMNEIFDTSYRNNKQNQNSHKTPSITKALKS